MFTRIARWLVKRILCRSFVDLPIGVKELLLRADCSTLTEVVHWASLRWGPDQINKKVLFDLVGEELDKLDGKETYLIEFFNELRKELREKNPWFIVVREHKDLTIQPKFTILK